MEWSDDVNLRDFVYLDVERVKSLFAQLNRGLPTDRSESIGASRSVEGNAGISIPALLNVGGTGQYLSTNQSTETRTLHDFVYNQMEEKLLEIERLKVLPNDFTGPGLLSKDVRSALSPVEYVLVKGKVELSDYQYMMSLLSNINEITRIIIGFSYQDRLQAAVRKDEKSKIQNEMNREVAEKMLDDKYIKGLMKIFEIFVKDRLIITSMPFASDPNIRIVGPLQHGLLRERLDDIRFKFGSSPTAAWTVFGQIASVPPEGESRSTLNLAFSNDLDRALHQVFDSLRPVEDQFRVTYPEIAITPIAVYRDCSL